MGHEVWGLRAISVVLVSVMASHNGLSEVRYPGRPLAWLGLPYEYAAPYCSFRSGWQFPSRGCQPAHRMGGFFCEVSITYVVVGEPGEEPENRWAVRNLLEPVLGRVKCQFLTKNTGSRRLFWNVQARVFRWRDVWNKLTICLLHIGYTAQWFLDCMVLIRSVFFHHFTSLQMQFLVIGYDS